MSTNFHDANMPDFLIRWRGKQEGPYQSAVIEAKLATNQIGLLHEISHNGEWITLRAYFAARDAQVRAAREAHEAQERRVREAAERQAREREEQRRGELVQAEVRLKDLQQANATVIQSSEPVRQVYPILRKSHRAGTIIALALIGLFLFGPLCIVAWVMGDSDLREMDAGTMDDSGRSSTISGRSIGMLGTILWIIGVGVFFLI